MKAKSELKILAMRMAVDAAHCILGEWSDEDALIVLDAHISQFQSRYRDLHRVVKQRRLAQSVPPAAKKFVPLVIRGGKS